MNGEPAPRHPEWWQASDGRWYPPELHPNYDPFRGRPAPSTPAARKYEQQGARSSRVIWKRLAYGLGGLVLGALAWSAMILVTSGVCSVPVAKELWCSPLPGQSVPTQITLWDLFLLVVFVGGGFKLGVETATKGVGGRL